MIVASTFLSTLIRMPCCVHTAGARLPFRATSEFKSVKSEKSHNVNVNDLKIVNTNKSKIPATTRKNLARSD